MKSGWILQNYNKMKHLKYLISILGLFVFFLIPAHVFGQFTSARIGVNGLTCSACTRSVEMSLRKLPFIESVEMNLENTDGVLKFKKGSDVEISKIAKAVVDAGFSVRFLNADYTFSGTNFQESKYTDKGQSFYFIRKPPTKTENTLRFIGPAFQTKKEFTKYKTEFPAIDFKDNSMYYVVLVD